MISLDYWKKISKRTHHGGYCTGKDLKQNGGEILPPYKTINTNGQIRNYDSNYDTSDIYSWYYNNSEKFHLHAGGSLKDSRTQMIWIVKYKSNTQREA